MVQVLEVLGADVRIFTAAAGSRIFSQGRQFVDLLGIVVLAWSIIDIGIAPGINWNFLYVGVIF